MDHRPYLHPIISPDGKGVLTEYSPGHHKHQTGLYWGFTRINGTGADEETLKEWFYNKDKSDYTEITSTEESLQQKLQNPFHISVSNLSQNKFGFTDNSKLNSGEKVRYQKITTINEFVPIARYDTTGAKFVDSNRKTVKRSQ